MIVKAKITIKEGIENMDVSAIHQFLCNESYWAKDIPFKTVHSALKNSYCIGLFDEDHQIGFARLITDYSTFAYLADVYVLQAYRGKGYGKMMIKYLMEKDFVKDLRSIMLATYDAHALYQQFGFQTPQQPERLMELKRDQPYKR